MNMDQLGELRAATKRIAELREQVDALQARIAELEQARPARRGPGRPRKTENANAA